MNWSGWTSRRFVITIATVLAAGAALAGTTVAGEMSRPAASTPWKVAVEPSLLSLLEPVAGLAFNFTPAGQEQAEQLLIDGLADAALTLRPGSSPGILHEPVATVTWVAAAPFLSDVHEISLDEARGLHRGTPRQDGVVVLGPNDRVAGMRCLAVGGVKPGADEIAGGRYPFQDRVYILTRSQSIVSALLNRVLRRPGRGVEAAAAVRDKEIISRLSPTEKTVSLTVVGDIMLARGVASLIRKHGAGYPMSLVGPLISASDITFANLESPIGVTGQPIPGKMIWFRAEPQAIQSLLDAGIDAVTLANNHTLDYDSENLLETIRLLRENGIAHTGAGASIIEARKPAVVERHGVKVAFLGYSEFAHPSLYWSTKYPRTLMATATLAGTTPLDLAMIEEDIAAARKSADLVAVAIHWGQEYTNYPIPYFGPDLKKIARQTVDLGADMVFGFHPHAIQGIEIYRGRPIAYSLGNFVMDQKRPITRESMIITLNLARDGVKFIDVIPAMIDEGRPRPLSGGEAAALMAKIRSISAGLAK
ncbi:MAG: hypothetical protein HPY55_15680 [Firmicutes bacterium]|nr:hypothetical protein [Bacillota bacterium]